MSRPAALALLLISPIAALAAQHVQGDALQVWYQDNGTWNDTDTGVEAGIQALLDGEWIEFTYPGNPYQRFSLYFTENGVDAIAHADSAGQGTNLGLLLELDASTATERVSVYEYEVGNLQITKTETWEASGAVMLVHFEVRNVGGDDITDLSLLYEFDADPEANGRGSGPTASATSLGIDGCDPVFETLNDAQDTNGDRITDWAQSEGDCSGYTVGILACDAASAELGHYATWGSEIGTAAVLIDEEGALTDHAIAIRHNEPRTLSPGGTFITSFLISFDETATDALTNAQLLSSRCESCDTDGDGADNTVCGGDDCDDLDALTHPGATDSWYDGIDSDCGGEDDFDADADGYGSDDHGGEDCDDGDPEVNPGEMESWYDGVDQNCDGNDDDQDRDGYGRDEDCDDLDPDVWEDCGGEEDGDGGGDDGGDDDGGDDGIIPDDEGEEDDEDGGDDDGEDDEDKGGCAHIKATPGLLAGMLALLGLLWRRWRPQPSSSRRARAG